MGFLGQLFGGKSEPISNAEAKQITNQVVLKIASTIDSFVEQGCNGNIHVLLKPELALSILRKGMVIEDRSYHLPQPSEGPMARLATLYFRDLPSIQKMPQNSWSSSTANRDDRNKVVFCVAVDMVARLIETFSETEYLKLVTAMIPDLRIVC